MKHYDFLIVGTGLFGATFACLSARIGHRCLVIDRRPHVGGNAFCHEVEGILVHAYGPHIFHTDNREVWKFVNSFIPFNSFTNSPLANYKGEVYNLPFNMHTFRQLWGVESPAEAKARFQKFCDEAPELGDAPSLEEYALARVGREIYEKLIKGYTEKQWGRQCTELPASLLARIPLRFTYDNNYYDDPYQGIPQGGYTHLVERMLDGCDVQLGVDFAQLKSTWREIADKLVYTGPLDEYFDFRLGRLEWRSLRFEEEVLDTPDFQGNAVVNYTDAETPWTRIVEHKHFAPEDYSLSQRTVITREYPVHGEGRDPFYPVNDVHNNALADRYRALAEAEPDVFFGGRLADYRYYDMDEVISQAMSLYNSEQ